VSLTPEGEAFLPHAEAMLETEAAGRAILSSGSEGASGLLRVTAPAAFGRKIVAPLIPRLLADNPALRVDLELTDSVVDIVAAGFDVAIRIGQLRDSNLIARRLASNPRVLCAAPAYLHRAGIPQRIEDLAQHECLMLSGATHWPFAVEGRVRPVRVGGRFSCSSVEGLHEACAGGLGLALLSEWDVKDELAGGALVAVPLDAAVPQEVAIWAVYPTARLVQPKLRAFVAELERALRARADGRDAVR
jgi:DNA-binding transcriptional LysR family regulator